MPAGHDHHATFAATLRSRGYDGRYARKARWDGSEWPGVQIGNGVFWRDAEFEYLEHEAVPIAQRCD